MKKLSERAWHTITVASMTVGRGSLARAAADAVQVPGRTFWSAKTVLRPGQSMTANITFAVSGPFYGGSNNPTPAFYQGGAAYLVVTLPGIHPVYGQPNWQPYGQHFVLPIPGGPVRIVQNRLYETPLMGHFPVTW